MKTWFKIAFISALVFAGATTAGAGVSFQIGTDDFFLSVGDYDYLPYAYQGDPGYAAPQINFYDMMSQYGRWVRVSPFGRVWRPYASQGWRPYTYGHWLYTEYGPYWEGYEPWAWAGYHYGSWIFARRYGWVWVPGYEWHPGRVAWARGYDTIGWMPMPPDGYDYRQGRLLFVGRNNQFSYSDDDFGDDYGSGSYNYGGPYYDPRARDMYYNPSYASININLWVFIDGADFGEDNYADYELGPDYTRYAFDQRTVRISNQPMEQRVLENITRQQIQRVPVDVSELRTDKQKIRVIVPRGNASVERIRRQSPEVVRQVIAPAFAAEKQQFKGRDSKIQAPVAKMFLQESVPPRIETRSRQQVIDTAREAQKNKEQKQIQSMERIKQRTEQLKKEGKIKEPGKNAAHPVQNPADDRSAGGRVFQQQNTPAQPVNLDRNPPPRPAPQNETSTPPPSAQPAPVPPSRAYPPTHPENPTAAPPQNAMNLAPASAQPAPVSPVRPSQQAHPVNQAVPPSPIAMDRPPESARPEPASPAAASHQPRQESPAVSPRPIQPTGKPVIISGTTGSVNAKTDSDITRQAQTAVRANLPTVAGGISINTKNGIVTISGKVDSAGDAEKILQLVTSLDGVKAVKSKLSVKQPTSR